MKVFARIHVALVFIFLMASPLQAAKQPPNFIFILVDDLGADQLASYGHPAHRTPNLDRLAREGMQFRTCYTVPVCSPSRALLLTGRYGFRTGWFNFTGRPGSPTATNANYDLGRAEKTFAHMLKQAGYATGLAGRWLEYGNEHAQIPSAGFDEYLVWAIWGDKLPPGVKHTGAWERSGAVTSRYWNPCLIRNGEYVPTQPEDYGPDLVNKFCREFLPRPRYLPFLLYYPMILVQSPYPRVPDVEHPGQRKKGNLQSFVEYTDHLVGKLVDELDRLGLGENTIVFFAGDNGTEGLGKRTATERGARVPFIVRCPGTVKAGVICDALTDFSDVLPTLAEFAGAPLPRGLVLDGRSLAPVLTGKTTRHREWIFSYLEDKRILRDSRWLLEGDGRFYDCGSDRDGQYAEVTTASSREARRARARFDKILQQLPAWDPGGASINN